MQKILSQKYSGPEVDLWSMGVVLYTMLTKEFPFKNVSDIITGRFTHPPYVSHGILLISLIFIQFILLTINCVLKECCDLLSIMLKVDQTERATIDDVLNHPFLTLGLQHNFQN